MPKFEVRNLDELLVDLGGAVKRPSVKPRLKLCISARLLQPFLCLLPTYPGYPVDKLKPLCELDPESRVPIAFAHELLELAIKDTGDPYLGLKAGRLVELGDHGAFDFAMASAATVDESIDVATRYMRLLSDAIDVHVETEGNLSVVRLDSRVPVPRAAAEYEASCFHSGRAKRYPTWIPEIEWWFPHSPPDDLTEYERTFAPAKLRFSAPCFAYAFPKHRLQAPMHEADPKLNAVLRRHADLLLAELPQTSNLTEAVRQHIANDLALGTPSPALIARRLHLGSRTLARRLEDEGTTFSKLLEATRRRLSERYVACSELQFSEIALLVGFSEVAAFYRAFRRWTNQTPLEYRRRQNTAARAGRESEVVT